MEQIKGQQTLGPNYTQRTCQSLLLLLSIRRKELVLSPRVKYCACLATVATTTTLLRIQGNLTTPPLLQSTNQLHLFQTKLSLVDFLPFQSSHKYIRRGAKFYFYIYIEVIGGQPLMHIRILIGLMNVFDTSREEMQFWRCKRELIIDATHWLCCKFVGRWFGFVMSWETEL